MTTLTFEQVLALRSDIGKGDLAEIKANAKALLPLAALRERAGVTQSEMAARLGKSQAAISKFEGRGDFLMSTLYRHVSAVGWDLTISISSNGTTFDLVPNEMDEDVSFCLFESRKGNSHALAEHARLYSEIKSTPRHRHFKQWARPARFSAKDRMLNRSLGEPA
ncbi:helix-turn-helix domain-containing protein [Arenimonas aestuarii]